MTKEACDFERMCLAITSTRNEDGMHKPHTVKKFLYLINRQRISMGIINIARIDN